MRLATFDIFDTALIRKCGKPEGVFYLTAARLWPESEECRADFVTRRLRAKGDTIEALYADMGFSDPAIMAAEMAVESEMLTANVAVVSEIERLRTEGWTIKFLSDMYLPSEFLAEVLRREGCLKGDEEVIVSCEHGARKDTGTLYDVVRAKFSPEKWIHFGDNRRSDVKMARRKGVKATRIDTSFTPVEQYVNSELVNEGGNILASISRAARIIGCDNARARIASDYVAPVYVSFVKWVISQAYKKEITKLYFVNRDGFLMYEIAKAFAPVGLDLEYIFISRKALLPAYIHCRGKEGFMETVDKHTLLRKKVNSLLASLSLSRSRLKDEYGITFDYDVITTKGHERDFLNKIFDHGAFTSVFNHRNARSYDLTINYLRQQGLMSDSSKAMVDVGWLGTSRMMLTCLLDSVGVKAPFTFYLGTRQDVLPSEYGDFEAWFEPGEIPSGGGPALIEHYFSASPWPTTLGYKVIGSGEIVPEFPDGANLRKNEIVEANVEACCQVARMLRLDEENISLSTLKRWAMISLKSLTTLRHTLDLSPLTAVQGIESQSLVRKLTFGDAFRKILLGDTVSECDALCLQYTYGRVPARMALTVSSLTSFIRGFIFRKFIAH